MIDRPAGRRRSVLLAGIPDALAAAASEAAGSQPLRVLPAVPSLEQLLALDPAPHLVVLGTRPGDTAALQLLEAMKSDPAHRTAPVLVGAATWPADHLRAHYGLHANACLQWPEPASMKAWFADVLRFWLRGEALLALPGAD